ncbi:MAG: DoxX family protein [Cytophagales bacterium]|nr:DoxX family protein [Cytophagales bacterium]MDW8383225.1 DoxX family protein [Flammeovirgaceae bacterium]
MNILYRILVGFTGILFVFSGLIKINDPMGTAIKLEEYFEVFTNDLANFFQAFVPFSLPLAIFICTLEVVLGIALLVSFRRKDVLYALLALILFFTFLTFYSAYFNKVTDCGCFGDAIKLTPWQSFAKDVILLVAVVGILLLGKEKNINQQSKWSSIAVVASVFFSLGVAFWSLQHLPIFDFRAYKIGVNIAKAMQPEEAPDIEYIFLKDGKEIISKEYLPAEQGYEYKSYRIKNLEKTQPKIKDYNITDIEGNDVTQQTLQGIYLLVIYHKTKDAEKKVSIPISQLASFLKGKVNVIAVTSDGSNFEDFRRETQLTIPYYVADATMLKTAMRSNPGLMLLQDGWIRAKWHYNDLPTAEEVLQKLQ